MRTHFISMLAGGAIICTIAGPGYGQPLTIRTLAGEPAQGATNGFGSNARFNHPNGLSTDRFGNVYVADTENGTIRKITSDGYVNTFAGLAGQWGSTDGVGGNARFFGLQGIATDSAGNLYVADTANSTIRKVTPAGLVSTFAGNAGDSNSYDGPGPSARLYHPEGVAVDGSGNVYVADGWNHTIRKITSGGAVSTIAGLAGHFGSADGTNSKARFCSPAGIAVDSANNVFVTDSLNHTIRKIAPGGLVSTIAGLPGVWGSSDGTNRSARFYQPQGISVAPNGDLLVADSGNQVLRRVSPAGTNWVVSTVAGSSGLAGSSNGTGPAAQFYFPTGIASDTAGNVVVADAANNLIRTTRVVPPTLQIGTMGGQVVLTWPVSAEGFVLETRSALGAGVWSPVTNGVVSQMDNFVWTNSMVGAVFYRLHKP